MTRYLVSLAVALTLASSAWAAAKDKHPAIYCSLNGPTKCTGELRAYLKGATKHIMELAAAPDEKPVNANLFITWSVAVCVASAAGGQHGYQMLYAFTGEPQGSWGAPTTGGIEDSNACDSIPGARQSGYRMSHRSLHGLAQGT